MILAPPIPPLRESCLFLDIDGTLLDFAATPGEVDVDDPLRDLLRRLDVACEGALALVSGRRIADIDELFDPLCLAAAGVHGCERRDALGQWTRPDTPRSALEEFSERLRAALAPLSGVVVEEKGWALAVHYRRCRHLEGPVRAVVARLAPCAPEEFDFLHGNCVIEMKPKAARKGAAIDSFMSEPPFCGRRPIFIGDDVGDLDGFDAVRRRRGLAIGVGERAAGDWRLPDTGSVRRWLESLLATRVV
jgi:trehalose 6-phosphate phosphatase